MRPDKKLARLLGLAGRRRHGSDEVERHERRGRGERREHAFHGSADLYGLAGASPVATLDSGQPAVALRDVGAAGGQAAAFTYDLARSVVYTRQGNPAWAGTERDGNAEAIRSDDMFFGGRNPTGSTSTASRSRRQTSSSGCWPTSSSAWRTTACRCRASGTCRAA